jgi:hypothetical protein
MTAPMAGPMASPETEKPSSSLFGGLLKALYPAGAYEGIIPPEQLDEERRMALRSAGLSLLSTGQRPYPQGTMPGLGANLAEALNPNAWSQRLASVAQNGMQLRLMQQKLEQQNGAEQIIAQYRAKPGETDRQRDDRLLAMANALQAGGYMDEAKAAADLRTSLRTPNVGVHGDLIYDPRDGTVLGQFPKELQTPDGAQLYAESMRRLEPWADIRRDVTTINRLRSADLSHTNSVTLYQAAQRILNTRTALAKSEGGLGALEHIHLIGPLMKLLGSLTESDTMTKAQRDELLRTLDPMITQLSDEQQGVVDDLQRKYHLAYPNADAFKRMWDFIGEVPSFGPHRNPVVTRIDNAVPR